MYAICDGIRHKLQNYFKISIVMPDQINSTRMSAILIRSTSVLTSVWTIEEDSSIQGDRKTRKSGTEWQ